MKTSRLFLSLIVFVSLFAGKNLYAQALTHPRHLSEIPEYATVVSDRLLITYASTVSDETIRTILKNTQGVHSQQLSKPLVPGRYLITLAAGANREQVIADLQAHADIQLVSPWLKASNGVERGILPQLYLKPKSGDVSALQRIIAQYGGKWVGERKDMPGIWEAEFDKSSAYNAWEMMLYLNTRPEVEFADVNMAFFPKVHTNDSLFARQWALSNTGGVIQWNGIAGCDMDVVNAWTISTGDPAVRVAILDSGIDTLHPDLKPNLLPGYDATGHGSHGYPNHNFPSDGHGTSCAGIVAAKGDNHIGISGVAYDCKIIPVRIFVYIDTTISFPPIVDTTLHEIPYSETAYMLSGINWAWQTGGASVLSNSWGIPAAILPFAPINQPTISQAILTASQQGRGGKGAVPLFSSGNDDNVVIWPAGSPGTISVGATTNKDKRAGFSNYGLGLEVTAPGVQITTTDMLGANGFASGDYTLDFGGTSAACPNAAGVAALALSVRPDFTFSQVKTLLHVTAERVGGYNYDSTDVDGTWSQQLGYGRVNAYQALLAAPVLSVETFTAANASVTVYPNPTADNITLFTQGIKGDISYEIIDLTGKSVIAGKFNILSDEYLAHIFVYQLPAGLYHLRLQGKAQAYHVKFVKK